MSFVLSQWQQLSECRHQTYLCAHSRTFFSCAQHTLIRTFPRWAHRIGSMYKELVSRISLHSFPFRCHVFVERSSRPLPSCRFVAYLFSVTTFSVFDLVLRSLEWNVWLDSTHRIQGFHRVGHSRGDVWCFFFHAQWIL